MSISLTIEPVVLFSYPSAKDFTNILKTLSEIVDEVLLKVSEKGVNVKALDPSRVAMISVTLPAESFQDFKVEKELSIGLAVGNLAKILKQLKKGDKITMCANEENVEILVEGTSVRRYKFRNIEVVEEEIPELSPQYDVEASVLSSPFRTALSELASITNTIGFTATQDALTLLDFDTKRSTYKLTTASGNVISLNVKKENVLTPYDSEYLARIEDILRLSNILDVKFGSEAPLYLAAEFSGGKAEYYLAAKI